MCGEQHPDEDVRCRLEGQHPFHLGGYGTMVVWPNLAYIPPVTGTRLEILRSMLDIAWRTNE
jgi:hypothetical protein